MTGIRSESLEQRLAKLKDLRLRLDREISEIEAAINRRSGPARRRSRYAPVPDCGTEAKYHWHRANEPENWPLPDGDPCGCRAAHAAHVTATRAQAKATREAATRRQLQSRDREIIELRRLAGLPPLRRVS